MRKYKQISLLMSYVISTPLHLTHTHKERPALDRVRVFLYAYAFSTRENTSRWEGAEALPYDTIQRGIESVGDDAHIVPGRCGQRPLHHRLTSNRSVGDGFPVPHKGRKRAVEDARPYGTDQR